MILYSYRNKVHFWKYHKIEILYFLYIEDITSQSKSMLIESAELTVENLNMHNRSMNPGTYGYVIGWGGIADVKRYLFKSVIRIVDGNTLTEVEVLMYEDDDGEAWTVYSDVHTIHYDD